MDSYLKKLIAERTLAQDKQTNNVALDYLETFFAEKGLFVKRYDFNGHGALVATTRKNAKNPAVILAAHLDVVPGPDYLFELREEDGKYMGRGTFDMKFAIASYMHVLDTLQDQLEAYDFGVMITTEEEIGGLNGTALLVEQGHKPDVVILPDGAGDWNIETLAKGFLYGQVTTRGIAAHGSKPWDGDSATFKLLDFMQELRTFFTDQALNTNTLNISVLSGGTAINQIPAEASASLDIRFVSMAEKEKITDHIQQLCKVYDATYYEEPLGGYPCISDLEHPLVKPFAESIQTVTNITPSGTISTGASDARFFASIGVPVIICRPAGGGQHADSEWIDKLGFEQYSQVLVDYLNKVARA